jgi:multidrug resistance efflux pump
VQMTNATPRPMSLGRALPSVLIVIVSLVGFYALRQGALAAGPIAPAYAEVVRHAVAPARGGRVEKVLVHVGQPVKAGDPLAVLEGRALELARERARAELKMLQAKVEATAQDREASLARSELQLVRVRADERGDRAGLRELAKQMERLDGLLSRQLVDATEAENIREKYRTLSARVHAYDQAGVRPKGAQAQSQAIDLMVEPARQAVAVGEAELKELDFSIEQLTLRAPADGTVSTLTHRPGDYVQAGVEIASVVTTRPGVLVVIVPEQAARRVALGSAAKVRRDKLFSRAAEARVIELAPEVDEVPLRARPSPNIPAWGRRALIELNGAEETLPGEAYYVSFK